MVYDHSILLETAIPMFKPSNPCEQELPLAYLIAVAVSANCFGEAFARGEQDVKETATVTDHRPYAKDAIIFFTLERLVCSRAYALSPCLIQPNRPCLASHMPERDRKMPSHSANVLR
jgi:hypothetical protein